MNLLFVTLHARRSPQSLPLAAGCLLAALPDEYRSQSGLLDVFPDDSEESILTAIGERQPDILIEPIYLWNRCRLAELNRRLRRAYPALTIIGGGPETTGDPAGVLRECELDAAVSGAGEAVLPLLLRVLDAGVVPHDIPGVAFAAAERTGWTAARPPAVAALSSPWLDGTLTAHSHGAVLWEVARGCTFNCDFCFDAGGVSGVQPLPLQRLEREWELFRAVGVAQAWVLDSSFNAPPARGKALLKMLLRHPADIHLHFEAKAEHLDRETVELLAQLPCSVQVGLQSTDSAVLRGMHRPFDLDRFLAGIELLNEAGVTFGLDLIYGLPGDSRAGFEASVDRAIALGPNRLDLFPLAVLPGTQLATERERHGMRAMEKPPYTVLESTDFSAADLAACEHLATACGIFYNTGRAVGFLPFVLAVCAQTPSAFFAGFGDWLLDRRDVSAADYAASDRWTPAQVIPLQLGYLAAVLQRQEETDLVPLLEDLLNDHFHGAEVLLGPETLPAGQPDLTACWDRPLYRAATVRLVDFHYEISELQQLGTADLRRFVRNRQPTGSTALYLRRGGAVICESLAEEFALLLKKSDGTRPPRDILGGRLPRDEGEELVRFALAEGLLQAEKNNPPSRAAAGP